MVNIKVDLKNVTKFLDNFIKRFPQEMKQEIKASAVRLEKTYKSILRGNGHYKTGDLESSIRHVIYNKGNTAAVGSDSLMSVFMEVGTKAHVIKVKNATVLTDRVDFFGKEVNHPGFKGTHDLEQSYDQVIGNNQEKFLKRLKKRADKIK